MANDRKYVFRIGETLSGRQNAKIIESLFESAKWQRSKMIYKVFDRLIEMYNLADKDPEDIYLFIMAWSAGFVDGGNVESNISPLNTKRNAKNNSQVEKAQRNDGKDLMPEDFEEDDDMFDMSMFLGGSTKTFRD